MPEMSQVRWVKSPKGQKSKGSQVRKVIRPKAWPGQNIPGKIYPDNTYRTKYTRQKVPGQNIPDNMYWTKFTEQNLPDKTYRTKYTGQNIRDKIYLISCRPIRRLTLDVSIRVRVKCMVMVRIRVMVRVSIRVWVKAEWATEESPKHPMATHVWVYFKLKYTVYIFDCIFCVAYFVW